MDLINLNTLLFAGKWAFIGLVYLILMLVVIAVRREMLSRTPAQARQAAPGGQFAAGRLRVLRPGSDSRLRPGAVLPLKPETSLGAAADNDIILSDRYVSAFHARLGWDGAAWWIEDLGSTNGTTLDGRPCPPRQAQPASPGARLGLGDMEFELLG